MNLWMNGNSKWQYKEQGKHYISRWTLKYVTGFLAYLLVFSYFSPDDDILIRRPLRNLLHQVNFLHYDVMSWGNWHYTGPTILAPWWFWWLRMQKKTIFLWENNYFYEQKLYFAKENYIFMGKTIKIVPAFKVWTKMTSKALGVAELIRTG